LKLNGLHGVISQKMILFIATAVKTSNPTHLLIVHRTSLKDLLPPVGKKNVAGGIYDGILKRIVTTGVT
jgi:hypothetical protein